MDELQKMKDSLSGLPEEKIDLIITELQKLTIKEFDPQEIFPEGTIAPDHAKVRITLPPDLHEELKDFLLNHPDKPELSDLKFFPLGIIRNDFKRTEFRLGGWTSGG